MIDRTFSFVSLHRACSAKVSRVVPKSDLFLLHAFSANLDYALMKKGRGVAQSKVIPIDKRDHKPVTLTIRIPCPYKERRQAPIPTMDKLKSSKNGTLVIRDLQALTKINSLHEMERGIIEAFTKSAPAPAPYRQHNRECQGDEQYKTTVNCINKMKRGVITKTTPRYTKNEEEIMTRAEKACNKNKSDLGTTLETLRIIPLKSSHDG
eukprot:gene19913-7029_t